MDRRIFTQYSSLAALGVLASPLTGFQFSFRLRQYRSELPGPVIAHLDHFAAEMQRGLAVPTDHPLIQKYIEPVHIQQIEYQGDQYRFTYQNQYGQTISLSNSDNKFSTCISRSKQGI